MQDNGNDEGGGVQPPAHHLRTEALRIHKELIDKFSPDEVREIIRHLTVIEAVLTRDDENVPPLTEVD